MKRDNYNKFNDKDLKPNANFDTPKKSDIAYSYYSRVLKEPFDSIEELKEAEEAYYARLRAKEDKAAQKKTDAKKVEAAFVELNAARKTYKEDFAKLTTDYSESMKKLQDAFKSARDEIKGRLAAAEDNYTIAIKEFTSKYPEGYHLTLKDGDFETTISGSHTKQTVTDHTTTVSDVLSWLFNV